MKKTEELLEDLQETYNLTWLCKYVATFGKIVELKILWSPYESLDLKKKYNLRILALGDTSPCVDFSTDDIDEAITFIHKKCSSGFTDDWIQKMNGAQNEITRNQKNGITFALPKKYGSEKPKEPLFCVGQMVWACRIDPNYSEDFRVAANITPGLIVRVDTIRMPDGQLQYAYAIHTDLYKTYDPITDEKYLPRFEEERVFLTKEKAKTDLMDHVKKRLDDI